MSITIFSDRQNQTTLFANQEAQYYFSKMTGETTKAVENSQAADIVLNVAPDDQVLDHARYDQVGGKVTIVGNRPVALLIGLYQYLHDQGARFLRPGRANEVVPKPGMAMLQTEQHYDHTASYKHRGVCIEGADSLENIVDFIDWLPKNGFNSFFIQFANPYTFLKRWYSHQFNHSLTGKDLSNDEIREMSAKVDAEIAKRDLRHHRVGHGWTGEVLGYSSEFGWEDGKKLPESKKSLVAEVNGKRDLIQGTPIFTNLDMSNSTVNQKMAQVIVDYARQHSEVDYLHVWLSDGDNNVCECDDCQKVLPSDQYVEFLNYLDEQLTAAGLNTKICFLLYHELLFAPESATIEHPERFVMMFAPISRTFEKSYADVDYAHGIPEPTPYVRNHTTLPNSLEENLSFLFAWQKMFKGDSFVYDYPLGRAHYGDLGYMKISQIISRDVQYLSKLHLNGYISCQELRAGFPTTLPNYVMGRTLWDKSLSYQTLRDEYFKAAFGSRAHQVVDYLERISALSSSDYFNAIGPRVNANQAAHFTAIVDNMTKFLPEIQAGLAASTGVSHQNWRILDYHRQVFSRLAHALALQAGGHQQEAEQEWIEFEDAIKLHEPVFQQELDVYRITEVATNYAGFKNRDD